MANYQRAREDDVDFIPLRTQPAPEQDVTHLHLPTYDEVLSDEETLTAPQRTVQGRAWPTSVQGQAFASALEEEHRRDPTLYRRVVRRAKWGVVCMALAPGIGLIIGAAVAWSNFVHHMAPPTPGIDTYFSLPKLVWLPLLVTLLAMFILYGGLACATPLMFPRFQRVSKSGSRVPRRARKSEPRKSNGVIWWGFTVLYVGVFAAAMIGTIIFANTRLQNLNNVYLIQDTWAGSYVLLETSSNASSGVLYSSNKASLGQLQYTTNSAGWTIEFTESQPVQTISYANPVGDPDDIPIRFNASCNSNSSEACFTGGLTRQPPQYNGSESCYQDTCDPTPEFSGEITVYFKSPNPAATLNATSNVNVVTSNDQYQGIGKQYPPLGYWYFNGTPILQVSWPYSGPCNGLQIFLSREYEGISYSVLGLAWQWWRIWGASQGTDPLISTVCGWTSSL